MTIYKLGDTAPTIHESVFVADTAAIIGKVVLEENASVWFGATIRGDNETITVGAGSNVQGRRGPAHGPRLSADDCRKRDDRDAGHAARLHDRRGFAGRYPGSGLEWSGNRPQLSGWCRRGRDGRQDVPGQLR